MQVNIEPVFIPSTVHRNDKVQSHVCGTELWRLKQLPSLEGITTPPQYFYYTGLHFITTAYQFLCLTMTLI